MKKRMAAGLALCVLLAACTGTGQTSAVESTAPLVSAPARDEASAESGQPPQSSETPTAETEVQSEQEVEPMPQEIQQRIAGHSWNEDCPVPLEELRYITIAYVDFAGAGQTGEMIVHESLAGEVREIFAELYEARFPIAGMALIEEYDTDDLVSMAANNSYCFCSRLILGTDSYSIHSYGSAIDINPVQNPYVTGGQVYPEAAAEYMDRSAVRPGMIVEGDLVYNAFTSRGWSWGGHWQNPDYQHFEKRI